ncbi:glycine-rich domain-containing protein [Nocardia tenerifensis]|nr:hypothetical protein [Nocardia tenerifensis]
MTVTGGLLGSATALADPAAPVGSDQSLSDEQKPCTQAPAYTSSGKGQCYLVPEDVTALEVVLIGAGGGGNSGRGYLRGGGGDDFYSGNGGAGGQTGTITRCTLTVKPKSRLHLGVPAGGKGGTAGGYSPAAGNSTVLYDGKSLQDPSDTVRASAAGGGLGKQGPIGTAKAKSGSGCVSADEKGKTATIIVGRGGAPGTEGTADTAGQGGAGGRFAPGEVPDQCLALDPKTGEGGDGGDGTTTDNSVTPKNGRPGGPGCLTITPVPPS